MKFLFGLILPGGTIGKDEFSWSDDELGGREPIMFAETASIEYEEITNLRRIWNMWQLTGRDFLYAYHVALEYYATLPTGVCGCTPDSGRFHELSDDEKDAAVSLQVGPQVDRINFSGLTEVLTRNTNWNRLTYDSRLGRTQCTIVNLMVYLPTNYKTAFVELVENKTFYKYIQFAIEGTLEGDPEGIFDYILGRVGSSFDGVGLLQKPWTPINGLTMAQVCDLLMFILRDGDYVYGSTFLDLASQNFSGNINMLDVKISVRVASTGQIDLIDHGITDVDGVTMVDGNRILLKDQTLPEENGIYIWDSNHLVRAYDANNHPGLFEVTSGMFTFVEEGTTYATTGWVLSTPDPIVLDVTPLIFVQFTDVTSSAIGNTPTDITYAALMDLINTSTLVPGLYRITDRADQGIVIRALANNKIENYGSGIFLNADYNAGGGIPTGADYSGVSTVTGIAAGTKLLVWDTTQGTLHIDNFVYTIVYDTLVGSFLPGETVDNVGFSVTLINDFPGISENHMEVNNFLATLPGPYSGTITGATSGATANIVSISIKPYVIGETLTGGTSGSTAVVQKIDVDVLTLHSITGDFIDNETLTGSTSGIVTDVNGTTTYTLNPSVGDIVIWNNLHYQRTTAGIESISPDISLLYTLLPKTVNKVGYLTVINFITYNIRVDAILSRADNIGNVVSRPNLDIFQFGNNFVNGNKISPKAVLECANNKGKIIGNEVLGKVHVILNNLNKGEINNNIFAGEYTVVCNLEKSVKNLKVQGCYIMPGEDIILDITQHFENLKINQGFSNFKADLSIDDPAVYDILTHTLTIPTSLNYVGEFTLASIASTFDVSKITTLPTKHHVIFKSGIGKTATFIPTDIGVATTDDYISSNTFSDLIVGRLDGGDELVVKRGGIFNQKINAIVAVPIFDDKTYVHDQVVASVTWTVVHNLQKWPSVSIVNAANELISADVVYVDTNNLTITFGAAEAGRAFIN